jgi:plasmid stabilization system protein ParE
LKRSVRILRSAERDLRAILAFLARQRSAGPGDLVDRILAAAASLADHAERGARPRDSGLRSLGFRSVVVDSYLIFYKVLARTVRVYRILHGARQYGHLLGAVRRDGRRRRGRMV